MKLQNILFYTEKWNRNNLLEAYLKIKKSRLETTQSKQSFFQ